MDRKEFLTTVGLGVAGVSLLGASAFDYVNPIAFMSRNNQTEESRRKVFDSTQENLKKLGLDFQFNEYMSHPASLIFHKSGIEKIRTAVVAKSIRFKTTYKEYHFRKEDNLYLWNNQRVAKDFYKELKGVIHKIQYNRDHSYYGYYNMFLLPHKLDSNEEYLIPFIRSCFVYTGGKIIKNIA